MRGVGKMEFWSCIWYLNWQIRSWIDKIYEISHAVSLQFVFFNLVTHGAQADVQ